MKKTSLRWLSLILVMNLMFWNMASVAFAQELATPSAAEATPSGRGESTPSAVLLPDLLEATPSATYFPLSTPSATPETIAPTITEPPVPAVSASIRYPVQVRQLSKRLYRASDRVAVEIDNFDAVQSSVTVTGPDGKTSDVRLYQETSGSVTTFVLAPGTAFIPGKYTVQVMSEGSLVSTQDFYWGVLAINTNKSMFLPGETADLSMAVLNDTGDIVCNAQVRLSITDPAGTVMNLSTDDGSIIATPNCGNKEMIVTPDYSARYTTTTDGIYTMDLTATTANGTYSVSDSFEVRDFVPFDVERTSATRIYPPNFYPMTIRVKANTDFVGDIEETVPSSFTVREAEGVTAYKTVTVDSPPLDPTAYFVHAQYPFAGKYPVVLGFGEALTDPLLQEQYKTFGLVGHDGMDFGLPEGTSVLSVDGGTVILAGPGVYGTTVVVQHPWGKSYYGHLSTVSVQVGDKVSPGDKLGESGHTGLSTGPHLHFGMKLKTADMENGYYGKIDPMPFLTGNATVSDASVKHIRWHVSLKTGDELVMGYQFQAPNISPQFYLAGPLTFRRDAVAQTLIREATDSAANPFVLGVATPSSLLDEHTAPATPSLLFSEVRQWQIAADATLNTLVPTAWSSTTGTAWTTTTATNADELVASYDSTYIVAGANSTSTIFYDITDMNADFSVMATLYYQFRYGITPVAGDTEVLSVQVFKSDKTTALTNKMQVVTTTATIAQTSSSVVAFTGVDTAATKADWDAAYLAIYTAHNANKGSDGSVWSIDAVNLTGTYTPAITGPTTDQQMRHGNWFNAGVEQGFTF